MDWIITIGNWIQSNLGWIALRFLILGLLLYLIGCLGSRRTYFMKDGKYYVQEGKNPPEGLEEHLRKDHPKEYRKLKEGK